MAAPAGEEAGQVGRHAGDVVGGDAVERVPAAVLRLAVGERREPVDVGGYLVSPGRDVEAVGGSDLAQRDLSPVVQPSQAGVPPEPPARLEVPYEGVEIVGRPPVGAPPMPGGGFDCGELDAQLSQTMRHGGAANSALLPSFDPWFRNRPSPPFGHLSSHLW